MFAKIFRPAILTSCLVSSLFAQIIDPTATYKIVSKSSGKVLDVANFSLNNGGYLHQWDYVGGKNQQWQILPLSNGIYKIVSVASGRVIDVEGPSNNNGATIHQWDWKNTYSQQWKLEGVRTGANQVSYKIINGQSGKVIDVSNNSTANGARIHQWDYVGNSNQLWSIEKVVIPFSFKWAFEDQYSDNFWNFSWTENPNGYEFLTANQYGNIQMSSDNVYAGRNAVKFWCNHNVPGFVKFFLPSSTDGNGFAAHDDLEAHEYAKDLSKANFLRFFIKGNTGTNFTISITPPANYFTYEPYCVQLSQFTTNVNWNTWTEVKIPMSLLTTGGIVNANGVGTVGFQLGSSTNALGYSCFFVDNIEFIE
jgi:hypothetical protein